jgi:Rod binding domain-containing protein
MSVLPTQSTGIAPIDAAQLPADVRKAGPKAERLYETALAFEQTLLQQLTGELSASTGGLGSSDGGDGDGSDGSDGSDASTSMLSQFLPQAFAQGITSAGGIGIARELYDALKTQAGIPPSGTGAR